MAAVLAVVIGIVLLIIHSCSYAKCREDENILVYEYAGEDGIIISNHDSSMNQMISYDDSYVYVDREAFEAFLRKSNVEGQIYLDYSRHSRESGRKPHSCYVLTEYCFSPVK